MLKDVDEEAGSLTEQDRRRRDHCSRLLKRIKYFKGEIDDRKKGWEEAREYVDGDVGDDGQKGLVRVNLIGSLMETVQPNIYAKAPEIAVVPDELMDTSEYPLVKSFASTLEKALNTFLVRDAKLKKRGKTAVRGALTSTIGWVKVIYQKNKQDDPLIRNRINDTQDNIQRINALIAETSENGGDCKEYEAKLFELNQQIKALEKQVEVVTSEGLAIDYVNTDSLIVLDSSCRDIDEFMMASDIAHEIHMSVADFKLNFKRNPPKDATLHGVGNKTTKEIDDDDQLICVYEVWSLREMTVYTLCKGSKDYIRPPYQPETLGEQWYPFFGLQLRRVDGKRYPKSMVELLIELQDEYNTRKTNAREHRKKNLPVRIINKASNITDTEISAIVNRTVNDDVIGVTANPNEPLQSAVASLPEIPYNPQMYDTQDVLFDMEKVSNAQDAATGAIRVAKTATEAEIAASGMQGRTGEALDVVEDWLTDIAVYSAQLLLQNVPEEIIKKRFGQNSVWPKLSKKEYFELVKISIKAGSTAKPNKIRERDQWVQILPELQKAIETITIAKQQGNETLERFTINLLEETLKRFDEKFDVKELLGLVDEEGNEVDDNDDGIPPEVLQTINDLKTQLQALQAENEQLRSGEQLKNRELDIKQQQADTSAMESLAKMMQPESEDGEHTGD